MRTGRRLVQITAVLGAVVLAATAMPAAQSVSLLPTGADRYCGWPVVYPKGANYAWPDTNAAYINQVVMLAANEKVVITGRDPKARYWSITTYNFEDREVIDRVNDVTVKRAKNGTWTVTVSAQDNPDDPNSLKAAPLPRAGQNGSFKNVTVIMYRVYLSETRGYSGGPLPTVTLHHDNPFQGKTTERLKPCVGDQVREPDTQPTLEVAEGLPSSYFVRAAGGRFYPSYDTSYLAAQVPYDPDRVLVVTGKAPSLKSKDVRYWSLCQNVNQLPLPVVDCASDREITVTKGRYTIAVVTRDQVPVAERAKYKGVTFVDWGTVNAAGAHEDALLLLRHILPRANFVHSVDKVRVGDPASSTMGDYAPVISQVPLSQLRAS